MGPSGRLAAGQQPGGAARHRRGALLLLTAYCLLLTACCLLLIAHCLLLTAYLLPLTSYLFKYHSLLSTTIYRCGVPSARGYADRSCLTWSGGGEAASTLASTRRAAPVMAAPGLQSGWPARARASRPERSRTGSFFVFGTSSCLGPRAADDALLLPLQRTGVRNSRRDQVGGLDQQVRNRSDSRYVIGASHVPHHVLQQASKTAVEDNQGRRRHASRDDMVTTEPPAALTVVVAACEPYWQLLERGTYELFISGTLADHVASRMLVSDRAWLQLHLKPYVAESITHATCPTYTRLEAVPDRAL